MPAAQSSQSLTDVAPSLTPLVPGGQALQPSSELTPVAPEKEPAGHGVHTSELEAPITSLHVPLGQEMHLVPSSLAYVPASHGVHVDSPDADISPKGHITQIAGSWERSKYVPALQSSQYDDPSSEDPLRQGRHAVIPETFAK